MLVPTWCHAPCIAIIVLKDTLGGGVTNHENFKWNIFHLSWEKIKLVLFTPQHGIFCSGRESMNERVMLSQLSWKSEWKPLWIWVFGTSKELMFFPSPRYSHLKIRSWLNEKDSPIWLSNAITIIFIKAYCIPGEAINQ